MYATPLPPTLNPQAYTDAALLRAIRTLQARARTPDDEDGLQRMLDEWRYRFDRACLAEIDRHRDRIIAR